MDAKKRTMLLSFFLIFSTLNSNLLIKASDTISRGQSLSGKQTIVSNGGMFELGFFTPGNSRNYYIGIWYKNIPGQTIIWVANRAAPVANPMTSKLTVSETGNLVLYNGSSKILVWSTNSSPSAASAAVLLDTGNLVLINGSNSDSYIWQSFHHPTNTGMPGGRLGVNKITGEYQSLTPWKNSEDPAPGLFGQRMDPDGSNQYVLLWNGSKIYWTSGLWNGQFFSNVPGTIGTTFLNFSFVDNKERKFMTYTILVSSVLTQTVVDSSGQLQQWLWLNSSQQWQTIYTEPLQRCDVYSLCGPYGVCDDKSPSICQCSQGFQPENDRDWELNDWSSGCSRRSRLQCGEKDGFFKMDNVRLPANPENFKAESSQECETACLKNCSCNAYAYGASGCSHWKGDLRNLQQLHDGDSGGSTLFLRLLATDIPPSSSSSDHKTLAVILGVVFGVLAIICIGLGLAVIYRRRKRTRALKQVDGFLIQFSNGELQRMTRNFSEKLGSGGFGTVFKGRMPDSTAIAVKKLEGLRQGEKQFRAEVSTLGAVQHVNLVRLRGFCCKGSNRLLVYDYMSEGSLDHHLFGDGPTFLNWSTRFQIVLGTARGLEYLHEKCRERIVHCDVKPDNILLDEAFCAKVSDFGMAKLIGRDFSRVLTTMRGTVGYLAPEWLSGLPITPKVDVYSFGMMLFELVSGRRNMLHAEDGNLSFYPSWAARKIVEGDMVSLLDVRLEGVADIEELSRVGKVAVWCIQDLEDHRPAMGQVVQILEGVLEVNTPPMPAALQNIASYQEPLHLLRLTHSSDKSIALPLDVLFLGEEALEDALFAKDVAFLAAERVDEGLEAEAASIEGLDRILAEPLLLGPVP